MIDYKKTERGDILKIVGAGAPGYAELGDLVRALSVHTNSVWVENRDGKSCEFVFNCGAARLEPTEWKDDFPEEGAASTTAVELMGTEEVLAKLNLERARLVARADGFATEKNRCWRMITQIDNAIVKEKVRALEELEI